LTSKPYKADDHFIGLKNFPLYLKSGLNIKQIKLESLTLFELIVLADAAHNCEPLYKTLATQCFWFSSVVFGDVAREYKCKIVNMSAQGRPPSASQENYLPNKEGTWNGYRIYYADEADISTSGNTFEKKSMRYFL
jgi:hypothetical protein